MEFLYKIIWLVFILSVVHQALSFYIDYSEFLKFGGGSLNPRSKKSIAIIHELLVEISKFDTTKRILVSMSLAILAVIIFAFLGLIIPAINLFMFIKKSIKKNGTRS